MDAFFVIQATKNLLTPAMVLTRFSDLGFPAPKLFLLAGVLMMYVGGISLVIDYNVRVGATILLVFTFLATIIFQRWWTVSDPMRRPYNYLMFFYNVFIMGALLLLL